MKESIKNRKKKFLALCLSAMMLSSVAAIAACSDEATDSSSSSSSSSAATSEEKDTGLIKNAGFETYNEDNRINTSVTGWTRSNASDANGSATTSKAASGIIDLSQDAWDDLTKSTYTMSNPADATEAEANWDKMSTKDKLAFYDAWKKENTGKTISSELDFYESFNIDTGDLLTIDHFDTHDGQVAAGGEDTKVLMIHNQNPELADGKQIGTAQKFTSTSTVTVKAGTSAKFSVWVKTLDLQSSATDGTPQDAVGKGAYVSVTHSVGSTSMDPYTVKNINTQGEWKQYSFLLKGASYTDTTFSLVLGLGEGSNSYRANYVNGYAFFDDIECEIIDNSECKVDEADKKVDFSNEGDEKIVDTYKEDCSTFALDFFGDEFADDDTIIQGLVGTATTSEVGYDNKVYSSVKGDDAAPWINDGGFDGANDIKETVAGVKNASGDLAKKVYAKYFEEDDTLAEKQALLFISENGAAYTAETADVTIGADENDKYVAISFFVKTSAMEGKTGASVTLTSKDGAESSFSAIDTTTAAPITVTVNGEEIEDYYKGWQQYFFFVENATEEEQSFTLTFNYGPTAIAATSTTADFVEGFAAFASFQTKTMEKAEFESASANAYAKIHTISEEEEEESATTGFDAAASTPSNALEIGLANLSSYKGIYSDSQYLTGKLDANTAYNEYANAGLLNKKHFLEYYNTPASPAEAFWLYQLQQKYGVETKAAEVWNAVFGNDSSQPLFIYNDGSEKQLANAYGFRHVNGTSIAANTYVAVSVRVKGSDGAKAYIRLADADEDNYNQTLSIGRNVTYWYDDEGNIYNGDPSEERKAAFKLQSNGLYLANKTWNGYDALSAEHKSAYFANLSAYAKDPVTGDLLVAEGGASHDYNDKWNDEGSDGIAFYAKDGKYYADKDCAVEVLDLSAVTSLTHRYDAVDAANQTLEETVTLSGEWQYVTFYIHTGDTAKNYRLEVFSGAKENGNWVANKDGEYVIFDTTNPGTAESNFTGLIEQYGDITNETLIEELKLTKLESVFSYFDTAAYLRYNADLDENSVGNLYQDNYTASSQAEGIAFLKYVDGAEHNVFADYSFNEKTITASTPDNDTSEDSSEDETENETNVWLLISSLSVAGVLLIAIVSIVARKIIVNVRKNKAANPSPKKK